MVKNVGFTRRRAEGQIFRYMAWPGQATAYMTGLLAFLNLRDERQANPGFDLTRFHDTLLTNGAVPLSLLDEACAGC